MERGNDTQKDATGTMAIQDRIEPVGLIHKSEMIYHECRYQHVKVPETGADCTQNAM